MKFSVNIVLGLALIGLASCGSGVSKLDFVNKTFQITYNLDSTRGFDSLRMTALKTSQALYNFGDDGKGTMHIQTGMLSEDNPFTWQVQNDTLFIDQKAYAVRKQDQTFVLRSDSVKMFLSEQQ